MRPFSRIFALAPDCHAPANRYGPLWRRHFYEGLAGVVRDLTTPQGVDFGWARPASEAPVGGAPERAEMSERLRAQIAKASPDVVVSYCFASDVEPGLVRDTVAAGIPWINFFCDSVYAFAHVAPLAREASLNWFPETAAEADYRALGRPVLCRPYALNAAALPEAVCGDALAGLGFVGAARGGRAIQIGLLGALGCRVTVHGEGWRSPPARAAVPTGRRRTRPVGLGGRVQHAGNRLLVRALSRWARPGSPLPDGELAPFVAGCRVVLGLNEGTRGLTGARSYLKLRDVEFPGYGACYLTQHNPDVARAFEIGREVLTFRTLAEAAATARACEVQPEMARAIGRAGRRRVLGEHTWATRLDELRAAL